MPSSTSKNNARNTSPNKRSKEGKEEIQDSLTKKFKESGRDTMDIEQGKPSNNNADTHPAPDVTIVGAKKPAQIPPSQDDDIEMTKVIKSPPKNKKGPSSSVSVYANRKPAARNGKGGKNPAWTIVRPKGRDYKDVDCTTPNRRSCNREYDMKRRERTPERTNRSIGNFAQKTRVTLRVKIPASTNPQESIINVIREFTAELDTADNGAAILPWSMSNFYLGKLDKKSAFPPTTWDLKDHVKRLFNGKPNEDFNLYPQVFIGHNTDLETIKSKLQTWLVKGNHAMYRNMLQAEDITEIGWLLYSTRAMDAGALADEIKDVLGVKVGLRWKTIDNGVKNMPKEQKVNALVVEVDTKTRRQDQKILSSFYTRTNKDICDYPNGIRLRFIKSYKDAINMMEKNKMIKLRRRQKEFLKTIRMTATWDIVYLDFQAEDRYPSLRQMIMSICSSKNNKVPLFHSVDLDFKGSGFNFQYSDSVAAEAECVIHTLIPYLDHFFPGFQADAESYFESEAVERCASLVFDPDRNAVIDIDSTLNEVEIEIGDELEGFQFPTGDRETNNHDGRTMEDKYVEIEDTRPKKKLYGPGDEDSVSTFGGAFASGTSIVSRNRQERNLAPRKVGNSETTSVLSSTSGVTLESFESLKADVDQKFSALTAQNSALTSQISQLCKALGVGHEKQSATDHQAGSPDSGNSAHAGGSDARTSGMELG